MFFRSQKGFTLIELLVVISIIGLLSSVVLSSLNSAREGALSAAVKSEAYELFKVAYQAHLDLGDYRQFTNYGWISNAADCSNHFDSGAYQSQAIRICESIWNKIDGSSTSSFMVHCPGGAYCDQVNEFSITVRDNNRSQDSWFCVGSSGAKYEGTIDPPGGTYGTWEGPGCVYNP